MNRKKPRLIHHPKKMVFSRTNSFNSSILNLSVRYKKQVMSLRANNRELARQLNVVQLKLKASENVIVEMQKTYNQQALKVIHGNLNKMAAQLRPFLDTLEQSIHFCAYPDAVNVDSTILNPDLDVSATPPQHTLSASGLKSEYGSRRMIPAHRMNSHLEVFPMTPIQELSTSGFERADLLDSASRRKSASRFSNVTRRTKSKGRSSSSNSEGTSPHAAGDVPVESSSETEKPVVGCFVDLERLPSFITAFNNTTPDMYRPCDSPVNSGVTLQMPAASEKTCNNFFTASNINTAYYDDDDDNVTVKIPVDMDLTMVKETCSTNIEVAKPHLKDAKGNSDTIPVAVLNCPNNYVAGTKIVAGVEAVPNLKPENPTGLGKVLIHIKENKTKGKLQLNNPDKAQNVLKTNAKTGSAKSNTVAKSTKIPKLITKDQASLPQSKVSLEQVPTISSAHTIELCSPAQTKVTKRRSILRVSLASSNKVENDNLNLKNTSPSVAKAVARKSVCFTEATNSPESPDILTKRTKRLTYIIESSTSSSSEDSDYCPEGKETGSVKKKKIKPKRGSENFRFFSKKGGRVDENKPPKRKKKLQTINQVPAENDVPSVYDLPFNDTSPSSERKTVTRKSKKSSQANIVSTENTTPSSERRTVRKSLKKSSSQVPEPVIEQDHLKPLSTERENDSLSEKDTDSEITFVSKAEESVSTKNPEDDVPSRRRAKVVSYKEQKLNKKMRRE